MTVNSKNCIRIKPDVDIYIINNNSLVFKLGANILHLNSELVVRNSHSFIKALEKGVQYSELQKASGVFDSNDFEALFLALMNGSFFQIIHFSSSQIDETIDNLLAPFTYLEAYNSSEIYDSLRKLHISICGPDIFVATISDLFTKYNIHIDRIAIEYSQDKSTCFHFPKRKHNEYSLDIIYMCDIDGKYRKELAYQLHGSHTYLPIHSNRKNFLVGPISSGHGPCVHCFDTRHIGNMIYPEAIKLLYSDKSIQVRHGTSALTPIDLALISSTTLTLCLNYVLGKHAEYNSRRSFYYLIDGASALIEKQVLFKNPYCGACSPTRVIAGSQDFSTRINIK